MSAITHAYLTDKSTSTLGNSSTQLLPANSSRNFLLIENTSTSNDVWVNLSGGTSSVSGSGCIYLPKQNTTTPVYLSRILFDTAVPATSITAIAAAGSTTVTVLEA